MVRAGLSAWGANILFAPDGSQVASLPDGRIALYDGETGAPQATLALPSLAPEVWLSYLPDSSGLVVAALDGRTWTVDTRISGWADRACETAGRNLTQDEWKQYFPNRTYEVSCPQWPRGT